ncbi:MAG: TRAP transporter small permease subunit [Dehalococcoidia bacterium]|nr:TRAP transporter small permease subunit [Dehalococcoidia bacterium]
MRTIGTIADWIDSFTRKLGEATSYIFLPMVVIALFEVAMRYIFNKPTIWAWDVNIQLQAALVALAGSWVFLSGQFIVVDVLVGRLMSRGRARLDLCTSVVGFFAIGMLTWFAANNAWHSWVLKEHSYSNWAPAMYPLRFVVLFGCVLLLLQLATNFYRKLVIALDKGETVAPEGQRVEVK